jgi:hypothetical protein
MTKIIITMLLAALSACGGGSDECQVVQKETPKDIQLVGNLGKEILPVANECR